MSKRFLRYIPLVVLAACGGASPIWGPSLGTFLVDAAPAPVKADAIVVLAGDWWGLRIEKGGELVRAGFASQAIVSGPFHHYGKCEADLAIEWAGKKGYPSAYFAAEPIAGASTEEEAAELANIVRKRGFKSIVLVTSNYHTRRAGRLWRAAAKGDFAVTVVAANDKDVVEPSRWYATREARKKIFFEWVKTLTGPFGV